MTTRLALALAAGWLLLVGALVAAGLLLHLLLPDPAAASAFRPAPASSSPSGESAPSVAPLGRTGTPRDSGLVPAAVTGDDRPAGAPAPSAAASPQPAPTVGAPVTGRIVRGVATWFRSPQGVSAAGPRLRSALGPRWRGTTVRVCAGEACVVTMLGDFMRADRLIDLDAPLFARLAPLSRGILTVTVEEATP